MGTNTTQKFPSEHDKDVICHEGAGALKQAAQGVYQVSFSGESSNPPGHCGAVQFALGDPMLAGGLDRVISRGP